MAYKTLTTLVLLTLLSGGCANIYSVERKGGSTRLSITDTFCIAVGGDGSNYGKKYDNPGLQLSGMLRSSLEEKGIVPEAESSYLSFYDALISARTHDCDYMVYVTIMSWEDHSTDFYGIPNEAAVKISVVDTAAGKNVDTAVLKAESGRTLSGDLPQDLLLDLVENYLSSLFGSGGAGTK